MTRRSLGHDHDDLRRVDGHEGWREMYHRMHARDGYKADESSVHFPRNEVTYGG